MEDSVSGRPLRFFLLLMAGWVILRFASGMLSENTSAPPPYRPIPTAIAHLVKPRPSNAVQTSALGSLAATPLERTISFAERRAGSTTTLIVLKKGGQQEEQDGEPSPDYEVKTAAHLDQPYSAMQPMAAAWQKTRANEPVARRWRGSAWLLWREGSANPGDLIANGRLGGSQAGVRLDYDLTPGHSGRTAIYSRMSAALNQPASPEAAVGIAWQPSRTVPVILAVERRVALSDGARNANTLFAAGGFGPQPVLGNLTAEGYAQAGMVGFERRDLFADGKLSLLAPLRRASVRTGVSVSGGAQPQVERLDVGPEIQVRLPLPRLTSRLSVEWRARVAGRALPSSGAALTLGADF